jgi:dihydroxyacetone kinase
LSEGNSGETFATTQRTGNGNMTTIFDAPEEFAATALAGFADVYSRYVRLVRGGVVRATKVPNGKVSVIVGGGSGH